MSRHFAEVDFVASFSHFLSFLLEYVGMQWDCGVLLCGDQQCSAAQSLDTVTSTMWRSRTRLSDGSAEEVLTRQPGDSFLVLMWVWICSAGNQSLAEDPAEDVWLGWRWAWPFAAQPGHLSETPICSLQNEKRCVVHFFATWENISSSGIFTKQSILKWKKARDGAKMTLLRHHNFWHKHCQVSNISVRRWTVFMKSSNKWNSTLHKFWSNLTWGSSLLTDG